MLRASSSSFRACRAGVPRVPVFRQSGIGAGGPSGSELSIVSRLLRSDLRLQAVRRHLAGGIAMAGAAAVTAPSSDSMQVDRVDCLTDNYVWLLREPGGSTAIVDPSEAKPVAAALKQLGVTPSYIFNTHHHWDHTGGNEELKKMYGLTIVGPKADESRIPGIDVALGEGDTFDFGQLQMRVYDTPGHTRGHITLYFPQAESVFPGDTLFAMGCGRLFEGTPKQMWSSLCKIKALPPQTKVFCAHEYTQANAKWAQVVNPHNEALVQRAKEVAELRSQGKATIPTTLKEELATNPFLRPRDKDICATLGVPDSASDLDVFTAVRKHKDNF